MYELLDPISADNVDALKELMGSVELRAGDDHGSNVIESSKWLAWTREERATFKSMLPESYVEQAVIGSFLHVPADTGYLEPQTYWENARSAGTMVSYALEDNLEIIIDGEVVEVAKGEGIKFSLKTVHEIKSSDADQNWACLMLLV